PFESFRAEIEAAVLTPVSEKKSTAGRKPIDVMVMFRMPVLQSLYNLSDEQVVASAHHQGNPRTGGADDCRNGGEHAPVEGDRDHLVLPQRDAAVVDAAAGDVTGPRAVGAGIHLPLDGALPAGGQVD